MWHLLCSVLPGVGRPPVRLGKPRNRGKEARMETRTSWRQGAIAGLAALHLLGLGFLAGMTADRLWFDAERTMILARLTLATMQAKERLMLLELNRTPGGDKSDV